MSVRRWFRCVLALALLAAAGAAGWSESDYAVIRAARPGARVRVVHRLAFISWNGREEVMVLATSFSADGEATVLRAFPLPDLPSRIAVARPQQLWCIDQVVGEQETARSAGSAGGAPLPPGTPPSVVVPWYASALVRAGTVIAPENADAFLVEATAFAARQGGRLAAADGAALRAMAARYLADGYRHFVLEAIGLSRGTYMAGPASYRFRSDRLFFPVFATASSASPPQLQLFLFTRFEPQQQALPPDLKLASFHDGAPVRFAVTRRDLLRLPEAVTSLFPESDELVLTAVERRMPSRGQDLVLPEQPPASPRLEAASQPPGGTSGGVDRLAAVRGLRAAVVTGLAWSPAGDRLCVVEYRMGDDRERAETATVLDLATGSRNEVAGSGRLSPHGWSPDGRQISFLDDTGNVQVVDVEHDWAWQVTGSADDPLAVRAGGGLGGLLPPAWSASGEWLAFGASFDVWVVRPNGRDLRQLTHSGWAEGPPGLGAGPGAADSGRRTATRGAPAAVSPGRSGGPGGGGAPGTPIPSPHRYAWSPRGDVLAYGEADAEEANWSVQGYEPGAGRAVPVRGELALRGVGPLSWQPRGEQLAVVGFGRMAKQTVYLIPRQGAIREFPTALNSVEVLWTGDGRTLLIRGEAHNTQRLTVEAVEAEGGALRTLPPTHFLADREVTAVAARPGSDEFAFALGANVYLVRADGSKWRRLSRSAPMMVTGMANPLERWQRDPVVLEAARRWRRAVPRGSAGEEGKLVYGIWDDFLARWKARLLAGEWVSYRDLPADQQREVLTGLVYQTFRSAPIGGDPGAVTVPGWYWWLKEARLGLVQPDASRLLLTLEGPDDAATAFVVSSPRSAGRRARNTLLHFWWPALFGVAAVIVALLGWRQARRQRGTADESHSAH